jgi:hypothetical protein
MDLARVYEALLQARQELIEDQAMGQQRGDGRRSPAQHRVQLLGACGAGDRSDVQDRRRRDHVQVLGELVVRACGIC